MTYDSILFTRSEETRHWTRLCCLHLGLERALVLQGSLEQLPIVQVLAGDNARQMKILRGWAKIALEFAVFQKMLLSIPNMLLGTLKILLGIPQKLAEW